MVGLGGENQMDILVVNEESSLRYVTSLPGRDGAAQEGRFPVDRGTVVRVGKHEASLWAHRAAEALEPRNTYCHLHSVRLSWP